VPQKLVYTQTETSIQRKGRPMQIRKKKCAYIKYQTENELTSNGGSSSRSR
jgi:hypothetical protein